METKIGLKITTLILQYGLSKTKGGILLSTSNINSECRREEICKSSIDLLLNNAILDNNVSKC